MSSLRKALRCQNWETLGLVPRPCDILNHCNCQKKRWKKSHVLVLRKRFIPWYLCQMSTTSNIWTLILLVYLSLCWPYLNFPLIYCPLRMSPRALFVSVMWTPSRNGAVNIQWVHQTPWREIKRRKKLGIIWRKKIMPLEEKIWICCVMSVWSHNEVVCILWEQILILLSLLFAGINITCSRISIQSGSFSRKVWATYKITYFGYIYSLNVNM